MFSPLKDTHGQPYFPEKLRKSGRRSWMWPEPIGVERIHAQVLGFPLRVPVGMFGIHRLGFGHPSFNNTPHSRKRSRSLVVQSEVWSICCDFWEGEVNEKTWFNTFLIGLFTAGCLLSSSWALRHLFKVLSKAIETVVDKPRLHWMNLQSCVHARHWLAGWLWTKGYRWWYSKHTKYICNVALSCCRFRVNHSVA